MSDFCYSVVVWCTADNRSEVEANAGAIGHLCNMVLPLSADGKEPATHYAMETSAAQSFVDILTGDAIPPGFTAADSAAMRSLYRMSVQETSDGPGHLASVMSVEGLQIVEPVLQ